MIQSQQEIETRIRQLEKSFAYVLTGSLATIEINAPRALMQLSVEAQLKSLYWVLGKKYQTKLKGVDT